MKKIILFSVFLCVSLIHVYAMGGTKKTKQVTVDGINYNLKYIEYSTAGEGITPESASVTTGDYSGELIIPEKIVVTIQFSTDDIPDIPVTFKVSFIESFAFDGCSELTSITIPESIIEIGANPFRGCTKLKTILSKDNQFYYDSENNAIMYNKTIITGFDNTTISALYIADYAFSKCTGLTSVTIPKEVLRIGSHAFEGCPNLTDLYVYWDDANQIYLADFFCCSTIFDNNGQNITLHVPDYVISEYLKETNIKLMFKFKDIVPIILTDYNLTYYVDGEVYKTEKHKYGDIITPIEDPLKEGYTFSGWSNVPDIMPNNDVTITGTFTPNKYKLTYMVDGDKYKEFDAEFDSAITPEAEPTKEGYTFSGWSEIPETMPDHDVTVTGSFSPNTYKLTYNIDGEEYKVVDVKCDEAITVEPDPTKKGMTFSGWSEIPETMPGKDIGVYGTFSWSKNKIGGVIYEVADTINNNAAVIGNDNTSGDVKITSPVKFDYDYSITDIVDFSFKNNADITAVVIPESVRKIGDEAFYGCKNIAKIELGKSVNQIEPRAFAGIDKLEEVIVYAENVPDADRTAFENSYTEDYVTLHVPAGSLEKYKAAAPWKNFKEIVAIEGTEAEPAKYTLIYQVDGETYEKYELEEGAEITALEEPTKEGYTFSGWDNVPETMPANDVTVTGKFTVNKYLLIYMVDDEIYKKYDVEYGAEITAEKEPEKEGYTFSGWSTIPESMPAKDVIIKGTFTQNAAKEEEKEEEVDTGEDVIKITSAGQTTWCSKYDLDFTDIEGLKAYIAPGYDRETGTIWLMRVFKVPAGEGILLMGDEKEYKVPHKPTSTYYTNMFVGTTEPKTIYESEGEYTNYYLSSGTSGVGFYRVTDADGVQLKANRAYLPLKTSTQASTRGFVGMDFGEDGTTGMRNLTPALSKGEGVYYNLQGQRVDNPGKGLYILNGKKVVVR